MEPTYRHFLIAVTAAVVIAGIAGLGIAETQSSAELVVADTQFSDEQAGAASVSVLSFFYFYEGEYTMAEHLQGL